MTSFDPDALDPAALLGRPELETDLGAARRALGGRRIVVTGAGGSVGTHLAELLLGLEPARLVLLDHHDHALHALKGRLDRTAVGGPWGLALADVRDRGKLARVLDAARPEAVFHLAAYKHVPFGEEFPEETFAVNVSATASLLELAAERDVTTFVYPSSDKAVNPPSVYGATKRLSELLVQRAARRHGRRFGVARYVNILGTRGSVVETFARQLADGGPVTVTDPRMMRYWISMREATWLLAQVAALGASGAVLMLDARDEVPILDTVARVHRLLTPEAPEQPPRITGPRPGERLREELLSANESFTPGPCPGLLVVENRRRDEDLDRLDGYLEPLMALVDSFDGERQKSATMVAARALQ
jgi:FlaA1/EpsC-like NDP-sugar epimerase